MEDELKELYNFYADLYKGRVPKCNMLAEVNHLYDSLDGQKQVLNFDIRNQARKPIQKKNIFTSLEEIGNFTKKIPSKTSAGPDNIPNVANKLYHETTSHSKPLLE